MRRGASGSGVTGEKPDVSGEKLAENVSSSMRESRAAAASASANGLACSNRACTALLVVAEGVEDDETWERLRDLRCDAVQGWLVAAAMPPDETTAWLLARGSRGWQRPAAALPAATTTADE
jgi:hypothetical protein